MRIGHDVFGIVHGQPHHAARRWRWRPSRSCARLDVVGRTGALKSIRFTATSDDLQRYARSHRANRIDLNGKRRSSFTPHSTACDPLARSELPDTSADRHGFDARCTCRMRSCDPSAMAVRPTKRQHRVRMAEGVLETLCASMVNSFTFAWAEVCGRSYGGGVLELEPREAEKLLVPYRFTAARRRLRRRRLRAGDGVRHGPWRRHSSETRMRPLGSRRGAGARGMDPTPTTEAAAKVDAAAPPCHKKHQTT